jgi:hypothetical protein
VVKRQADKAAERVSRRAEEKAAKARRKAETPKEHWAQAALIHLSRMDGDRARERNGVGFSRMDSEIGNSFASMVQADGLSNGQWKLAVKLCKKYWGQVGATPGS